MGGSLADADNNPRKGVSLAVRRPRVLWYLLWNGAALLGGGIACVLIVKHSGALPPVLETLLLGGLMGSLRLRTAVLQRDAEGRPVLTHVPGEAVLVIALLRDGPVAALAVTLIAGLFSLPSQLASLAKSSLRNIGYGLLTLLSNAAVVSTVAWLGGLLYLRAGGHCLLTLADAGCFFQHPQAMLLPLLFVVGACDLAGRAFVGTQAWCFGGGSWRQIAREMSAPLSWLFVYVEALSGAVMLALWTAWGGRCRSRCS